MRAYQSYYKFKIIMMMKSFDNGEQLVFICLPPVQGYRVAQKDKADNSVFWFMLGEACFRVTNGQALWQLQYDEYRHQTKIWRSISQSQNPEHVIFEKGEIKNVILKLYVKDIHIEEKSVLIPLVEKAVRKANNADLAAKQSEWRYQTISEVFGYSLLDVRAFFGDEKTLADYYASLDEAKKKIKKMTMREIRELYCQFFFSDDKLDVIQKLDIKIVRPTMIKFLDKENIRAIFY